MHVHINAAILHLELQIPCARLTGRGVLGAHAREEVRDERGGRLERLEQRGRDVQARVDRERARDRGRDGGLPEEARLLDGAAPREGDEVRCAPWGGAPRRTTVEVVDACVSVRVCCGCNALGAAARSM